MEGIARWLLMIYLPVLAPIVLLTLFTWPWRLIGHALRGLVMAVKSTWRGYSRGSTSHRRRPFSFWRNVFMGAWLERARQLDARTGGGSDLLLLPPRAGSALLPPAFQEALLPAANETRERLHLDLRTAMLWYGLLAAFLFIGVVRPSHVPATASAPVSSSGSGGPAVDLSGFFCGLGFILALAGLAVTTQLASLLAAAGSPQQLYWFIVTWERALGGRQLVNGVLFMCALGAALAATYQLYAPWVFITLLFTGATAFYSYAYFWADATWCPFKGALVNYSQAFHRELAGVEALPARPSFCAFWELEPLLDVDIAGSLADRMHRSLWRESGMEYYVSSSGGGGGATAVVGAGANGAGPGVQLSGGAAGGLGPGLGGKQRSSVSSSGTTLTEVTAGEAAPSESLPTWPFMRYNPGLGAAGDGTPTLGGSPRTISPRAASGSASGRSGAATGLTGGRTSASPGTTTAAAAAVRPGGRLTKAASGALSEAGGTTSSAAGAAVGRAGSMTPP